MESILQEISGCSVYLKIDLCRDTMAHIDSEVKEECLREDLRFYFMNPCEKFRARQQIPWKMGLQILKIVMVTTQVNDIISSFVFSFSCFLIHMLQAINFPLRLVSHRLSNVKCPFYCIPSLS